MNHLFFDTFGIGNTPLVFLCGDDSLEILRATLARELSGQGKTSLIISDSPMTFPVEGQVLVDIKPEFLKQKIELEPAEIFCLCSEVKDDLLMPLDLHSLKDFFIDLPKNVHIISTIKHVPAPFINEDRKDEKFIFINVFGFGNLEGHLNKFINEFRQRSYDSFEENLKSQWQKLASQFCPRSKELSRPFQRILYLNNVKTLIDENQVIPIVRNIADLYDQVFIGDINEYKLKEI